MNTRTKTLPNHRHGVREVMLDKNGMVLPVISATRVSCTPSRVTTYQRPEVDGFVIRAVPCKMNPGAAWLTVNRYIPQTDSIMPVSMDEQDQSHKGLLSRLDPLLIEWLNGVVDPESPNLLPAGFGWDGIMTTSEYTKHERIRDLFISSSEWTEKEQAWFEHIVNEAVRTSGQFLTLNWEAALSLNNGVISVNRFIAESKAYVVTFDKDGKHTLHHIRRRLGEVDPNEIESFKVPAGTKRAILLRTNCMIDDTTTYGTSVELYEETKQPIKHQKRKH